MFRRSTPRPRWRSVLLLAAALALFPAWALAQTGTIRGTVAGAEGAALAGARVTVVGTRLNSVTDPQGAFFLMNVPAGTHQLRVSQVGHRASTRDVAVRDGEETLVAIALTPNAVELDALVVSASRQAERVTEAPATITRVGPEVIENAVGGSFADVIKEIKGLDFIQVGVSSVAINARGFNSSFNNRMLMLEDGRVSVLPENGLPVGQFTATPKVDLEGIEVLVGPGAALYGADASSGVIALQTKDPRQYPGTTVEVTGGNRQYKDVQMRHAGVFGDWGYKVAGEWMDADDWNNYLAYTIAVPGRGNVRVKEDSTSLPINWDNSVVRGSAALVRYFGESRIEASAGVSQTDAVGQTNVGRNQLDDWRYNFQQLRFSSPNWYVNAYRTQSQSGKSFALNRFADAWARNPSLGADSLRMLSDWPSDGRMYAAELQNNFRVPALLGTRVTWGAQYRNDVVSSSRQWLTDRLTGEDLAVRQIGAYAQTTTPVAPWLDVVLAGRVDDHENYATQFSPKAGLVVKPTMGQALRLTYNRAFKSPTILQTNFHIPDWTAAIAIYGNTEGFTIKNAAGQVTATYDPLVPEENVTWEAGYKGVLRDRLFLDVAAYRSSYTNFMSPLVVIANPFAGAANATFAHNGRGELIRNDAGLTPVVLTYYNLGEAQLSGMDAGVNYVLNPRVNFRGTLSLLSLDDVEVPAGREEATSLNSPELKWTLGAGFTDLHRFTGGATVRHVGEYYFRSGINMGVIPTFTTLDLNLGYQLPWLNSRLNVGVSNLFTCGQDDEVALQYSDALRTTPTNRSSKCGIGLKHQEMINMPHIGPMLFIGFQYQTR